MPPGATASGTAYVCDHPPAWLWTTSNITAIPYTCSRSTIAFICAYPGALSGHDQPRRRPHSRAPEKTDPTPGIPVRDTPARASPPPHTPASAAPHLRPAPPGTQSSPPHPDTSKPTPPSPEHRSRYAVDTPPCPRTPACEIPRHATDRLSPHESPRCKPETAPPDHSPTPGHRDRACTRSIPHPPHKTDTYPRHPRWPQIPTSIHSHPSPSAASQSAPPG